MKIHAALKNLNQESDVLFQSSSALADRVRTRPAKLDRGRIKNGQQPHARPKQVTPVPGVRPGDHMSVTPWQVLHTFARATALAGQGSARALAQHWDCLRYVTSLDAASRGRLRLSGDGNDLNYHRKAVQARDLGTSFGLAAAQHVLRQQYPDYRFDSLDAELVLTAFCGVRSGKPAAGTTATRPNYFLVGRKPGSPPRLVAIDTRGSHSRPDSLHGQLVLSQQRVHTILIGESDLRGNPVPALMTATGLRHGNDIETRLLAAEGNGVLAAADVSLPAEDLNLPPWITCIDADGRQSSRPGFAVPEDRRGWLSRLLVRTSAASLLTFAGDRAAASDLLTERQRKRLGTTGADSVPGAQGDASITLGGMSFVGTDQVFRLKGRRVEVYSALLADQYDLLAAGRLDEHEARVPTALKAWHRNKTSAEREWKGHVHMDASGALLAIRVRRQSNRPLS
ncbi:hypothetical protein OOZ19_04820 [Saccharopolyspora sp. NFXS83]|uniref:hypothetical protein n=1 Tax=Saccharopolyspora sp. NFXS83 TaxID=2993560 RepID=UPI00224A9C67|nr:hypothetical protein [Saccharopolyspora sp. NFXS83]MCX2729550.1 hypothetical protein [Saccharopolyspora sp. NFXS83]